MAARDNQETRAVIVHERLRADILSGRLQPGERLKSAVLCERYSTSVGALREAFSKLADEGLVLNRPYQGYTVTPLSLEELRDLTEARAAIESLVTKLSVAKGDVTWEANAIAAHHLLERAIFIDESDPGRPTDEWAAAHTAFHFALMAGCPNQHLLQMAMKLRIEAAIYQMWSVSFRHDPTRDGVVEHRAMLDAALARDESHSAELVIDHLWLTANLLLDPQHQRLS